jgi:hypothetical protein
MQLSFTVSRSPMRTAFAVELAFFPFAFYIKAGARDLFLSSHSGLVIGHEIPRERASA